MQVEWKGVSFELDDQRGGPAFFILGVRKSGSSMFNRVAQLLSRYNDYNWVDVAGSLFNKNIKVGEWVRDPSFGEIIRGGNVYGGFRTFPSGIQEHPAFQDGKKVLLVRDPRDALVSEYFSNAFSHSIPKKSASGDGAREQLLAQREAALATPIDDYVTQRARLMGRTMIEYAPILGDPNLLLLKYEDIIFDKRRMITDVIEHFGWKIQPPQIDAILGWVDVKPEQENPKQFIRKVTPGDHADKLKPETIAAIDAELDRVLKTFEYA
jgi:hypothetical protein